MLTGCGHPDYRAVHAPALSIYAVVDSAPQLFPLWTTLEAAGRAEARHFTATLQTWAATERARLGRDLPMAQCASCTGPITVSSLRIPAR
jgi:hypothetical protein